MGGLNETVGEQKVATPTGKTEVVGKVRYHESGNEIHFHDDDNQLKVAIPVAEWFQAWQRLEEGKIDHWEYADRQRKTVLDVRVVLVSSADEPTKLDVAMKISGLEFTDTFKTLQQFSTK
jgi:hypothetical protein